MNLIKILKIGGVKYPIVSDSLVLEIGTAGVAIVTIIADTAPERGIVTLELGYHQTVERYFTGFISSCVAVDKNQQCLVIAELSAALSRRIPIAMRNVTATEVLRALSDRSGIAFASAAGADWGERKAGHFVNLASGWDMLEKFGRVYRIEDFCILPQPDGAVFVGKYQDSATGQQVFCLSSTLFSNFSATGADCAVLPTLRPGQRIRIDRGAVRRITKTTVNGNKMRIAFDETIH